MNAMSMNALGTFDPRDAMERWNQQTQNAQQNALLPSGGDAISFLPQPVQISGPMMPAMPQPQAMPIMPSSNAYDGGDYAGGAASAPAPAPAPAAPAKQSPNHSYDHGLGFGSGLAGRGPVSTTRAGRVAAAQKAGTFGGIQDAYNAANPTRWMDDNGQIGQRPKSVPFGGYRANGGPVQPGRAYVVGERGPELMVPQVPGTIVPNAATPMRADNDRNVRPMTDFNPVTGQASSFDGMSRTAFFGKAMQADPSKRAALGDGSGVYGDIQRGAVGLAPQTDARSFGAGGMNFVGPPAMPNPKPSPAPPALPAGPATGMLVAGPGGSVKWQRGTGPGTTLPPQTTPAAPAQSTSMPMMMPANNSRIAQSPSNRPYAELAGGTGSLANRGTRPVGRSANDPQRIAEQMRRRGDPSAILRFGAQQMGQDFARERDAVNFAQQQQMFGQQQQAMDARDAANYNQGLTMFEMQQRAQQARDAQNFEQQQQLEAGRRSADLAAQEQARQYGLKPVPVTGTATPYFQDAQGRIYAGSQPERVPEPVPQGLVPRGYQGGQTIYGPKDTPESRSTIREIPGEPIQDPLTKQWTTKPGQVVRIFEDGTYEPIQPRGQAAGPAPSPPPADAAARLAELRRKAGL